MFLTLGIPREQIVLCDSRGVVTRYRDDLNPQKREFATSRRLASLAEALHGADLFVGVSKADILTGEMVRTMAGNPMVLALANPDPEIAYDEAMRSRPDIIFATGRSDYPNQVNNVLGFPFLFRGALDVRAAKIDDGMKLAAARALAGLARQPVPESVLRAYALERLEFGRDYLIPKPLDPRLLPVVAVAVARAAVESGVARRPVADWDAYAEELRRLNPM
jgi:malate dehydrogenase (oxaloacetate-decarboxylating)(NADP+)